MKRQRQGLLRLSGLVIGVGLAVVLVRRVGLHALGAALRRVGPGFGWIAGAYALATAISAIPWGLLIPRGDRPSWRAIVASRFAASGVNALLPFFAIGESGRLLWMRRSAWARGTAAIVVDRLLFVIAGALLMIGAVGAALSRRALPAAVNLGGVLLALAIIAAAIASGVLAARGQLVRRGAFVLRRLGLRRGAPDRADEGLRWDAALRELLAGSRRALLTDLGIHVVARLLFALEIYAGLRLLGLPAGWRETLIFAAAPIALSVIGTFIPGQLGVQEATQALIGTALGIGPAGGLALVLLQRARQLLFVPLSGVLMALVPGRKQPTGA